MSLFARWRAWRWKRGEAERMLWYGPDLPPEREPEREPLPPLVEAISRARNIDPEAFINAYNAARQASRRGQNET